MRENRLREQKASDECGTEDWAPFRLAATGKDQPAVQYLKMACAHLNVLDKVIRKYGNHTIVEYMEAVTPNDVDALQPMNDLFKVAGDHITPLLGSGVARQVIADLERSPIVLTANHHGIAYFAQDFQGGLIFSLHRESSPRKKRTVPIFACGTIPLDNLTYPLGMLFYGSDAGDLDSIPKKIPLFSNKMRRQMVSSAKPFTVEMIVRAEKRLRRMIGDRELPAIYESPFSSLLDDVYLHPHVIGQPEYSHQSVVVNHAIWNRAMENWAQRPELVTLELEKITTSLLVQDVKNENSLAHCVMFDLELRKNVFAELDGRRACWRADALLRRLHADCASDNLKERSLSCGTMLFWGMDDRRRRVPLYLQTARSMNEKLCGVDDRGNRLEMLFTPASVREALAQRKILPSIFTSLLVLSLARGVACAGGYFQCDYLPAMQHGLVRALAQTGGYALVANKVTNVPTGIYLSGMIAVMKQLTANRLVPAGPLEIIAGGGLNDADMTRLQALTVRDAHLSALSETIPDLPAERKQRLPNNWRQLLAEDIAISMRDKIIIK